MNSLFTLRALLFAGECFASSALLLALAWFAARYVKQASLRHLVWLTAFGALLVLPAAALIVPPRIVLERPAAQLPIPSYVEAASAAVPDAASDPAPSSVPSSFDMDELALGLFVLWLMGVCWFTLRLAVGALGLAMLRRRSKPHALSPADLPRLGSNRRECELRLSERQDGPITWGFLRPVILLPRNSLAWSRARLQAVLLHELAHVRRRDSLSQSLSLLVCALYWPNPLVWMGARALRREAEIAADDAVIGYGVKPSAYAGELLQLAGEFRGRGRAFSGVAMAAGSSLEARVKSVLAPNLTRTGVTSMDVLKIACLGFAATAVLAFARPDVVAAQDVVTPSAPIAAPTALPAPAATPATPAAPDAVPAPPDVPTVVQSVQDSDDATDAGPADRTVQVRTTRHNHDLKVEKTVRIIHLDRDQIDRDAASARVAIDEFAKAGPEIDRAIAEAKIDEKIAKAMQDANPKIRAEVARALAQARPAIRKAIAEAHISERVAQALREAQPKIDAAMAKAQKRIIVIRRDDEAPVQNDEEDRQDDQ